MLKFKKISMFFKKRLRFEIQIFENFGGATGPFALLATPMLTIYMYVEILNYDKIKRVQPTNISQTTIFFTMVDNKK